MFTLLDISVRLTLFGVEPSSNSWFKMANSCGEVLLLFLRANDALSIEGSCDGYVAGEWLMNAKSFVGETVEAAFLFMVGFTIESLMEVFMEMSASESTEVFAAEAGPSAGVELTAEFVSKGVSTAVDVGFVYTGMSVGNEVSDTDSGGRMKRGVEGGKAPKAGNAGLSC
ncbi:hypothetical protein QG37_05890 [Candidozyma auris]|nr:hypothetical protein QG37_05890 [[Candida] auris]